VRCLNYANGAGCPPIDSPPDRNSRAARPIPESCGDGTPARIYYLPVRDVSACRKKVWFTPPSAGNRSGPATNRLAASLSVPGPRGK